MRSDVMADLQELRRLVPVDIGPLAHGKDFIALRCYCDFEGHGLASETWEEHWELRLPTVPYHWPSTTGWRRGEYPGGMKFHGRTMHDVVAAAVAFMRWWATAT